MKLIPTLLAVALAAGFAAAQTCTFTNFGRPCGGTLTGTQVRGSGVQMDVARAMPGEIALLVVGHQAPRPHPLPGSACALLVDPRVILHSNTDRSGAATFLMRLPNVTPLNVDFQCVVVDVNRTGRVAESTNGVNLVCR
ncbi:MAG: hypothetical protein IT457_16540 [Planctomycetes bacterium]|nr:hypothetical protein [Planctomycetota bacterium]